MTHATRIELWQTELNRGHAGAPKAFVRWYCACGRLGPALPLEGTIGGRVRAERRARNGGGRHVAAMERGPARERNQ